MLTTGLDDAGQQAEGVDAFRGTGAVADTPGDHPMAQGAFGGVVGQGQFGVVEHNPEGVPIVKHLARERLALLVLGIGIFEASSEKRGEHLGVGFSQRNARW